MHGTCIKIIQGVLSIVSVNTAALLFLKPASAHTFHESYHA
jgi:hypothetical protein